MGTDEPSNSPAADAASLAQLNDAIIRANNANARSDLAALCTALLDSQRILEQRYSAQSAFDGIATMLAASMALRLEDQGTLARALAALLLRQIGRELTRLNRHYDDQLAARQFREAPQTVFLVYAYAVTFVPRVLAPAIPLLLQAYAHYFPQGAPTILYLLQQVRPQLAKAGWHEWVYPLEARESAERAAVRALEIVGNEMMRSPLQDLQTEQCLHLGLNALMLLPPTAGGPLMARVQNLLGRVYQKLGSDEESLACFDRCIAIEEALGKPDLVARDRSNAGAVALSLAKFKQVNATPDAAEFRLRAEKYLTDARDALRPRGGAAAADLSDVLSNLAALYGTFDETKLAIEAQEEAWKLYQDAVAAGGGDPDLVYRGTAIAGNLGSLHGDSKDYPKAFEYLELALAILAKDPAPEAEHFLICHGTKGKLLCQTGRYEDARLPLEIARARLDQLRASFTSERTNLRLLKNYHWIYEWSIVCLGALAAQDASSGAEAFALVERVKWRSFTSTLRYLPLRLIAEAEEPLIKEETALLEQVISALGDPVEAVLLADSAAVARLEEIWTELAKRHPVYVALRRQSTVSAAEACALLDDLVPVLIEFYLGEESSQMLAFVLSRDGRTIVHRYETEWPAAIELVRQLRAETDKKPVADFNRVSAQLHQLLIDPLTEHLPASGGVCLVPYGELHNLPFGSLFDGEKYFVERHAVVIAPTVSAIRYWSLNDRREARSCLLFSATTNVQEPTGTLPDLHFFNDLAKTELAPLFARREFTTYPQSTKAALLASLAQEWDVVHVACHGIARPHALESFLVMSGAAADPEKDLTALEIASQVRCRATLVTLSACVSAVAQSSTGDEVTGLAQAFLTVGASAVLASNTAVRQPAGVAITRAFYKHWLGPGRGVPRQSKLEALQTAQVAALRQKRWFGLGGPVWHPNQWGAFQLYGIWH